MAEKMDLKALEKKAFSSMHQDGLWDIYLGLLMLGGALAAYLENIGLYPYHYIGYFSITITGMLVLLLGKKLVTVPRIGMAIFGPERLKKRLFMLIAIAAVLVLTFVIWYIMLENGRAGLPSFVGSLMIMMMLIGIFGAMAYFLDYPRLLIIGVLFAMAEFLTRYLQFQGWGPERSVIAQGITGALALAMGLYCFMRFVLTHPVSN